MSTIEKAGGAVKANSESGSALVSMANSNMFAWYLLLVVIWAGV